MILEGIALLWILGMLLGWAAQKLRLPSLTGMSADRSACSFFHRTSSICHVSTVIRMPEYTKLPKILLPLDISAKKWYPMFSTRID